MYTFYNKGAMVMIIVMKKKTTVLISALLLLAIAAYSFGAVKNIAANAPASPKISQKTVLLDPGHGGEDPGAVSDYSGVKEKDINLKIALTVKKLLEQENCKVLMTRSEDRLEYTEGTSNVVQKRKQDLLRRKKMMDEAGANIVVSIHLNKFPQTQYSGAQAFFPSNSPESQKLSQSIQKSIRDIVDPNNKREALLKKEPIIILKDSKTTTAVVECGFLSNTDEEKKLINEDYQNKLAGAIKAGIKAYLDKL